MDCNGWQKLPHNQHRENENEREMEKMKGDYACPLVRVMQYSTDETEDPRDTGSLQQNEGP